MPCPVFARLTLAFALQLRKKQGKNLSQGKTDLSQVKKNLSQSTAYILPKHPHITKPTQSKPQVPVFYPQKPLVAILWEAVCFQESVRRAVKRNSAVSAEN